MDRYLKNKIINLSLKEFVYMWWKLTEEEASYIYSFPELKEKIRNHVCSKVVKSLKKISYDKNNSKNYDISIEKKIELGLERIKKEGED